MTCIRLSHGKNNSKLAIELGRLLWLMRVILRGWIFILGFWGDIDLWVWIASLRSQRREVAIFYTTVFARNAVTWQSIVRGFGLLRFARKDDEWDSQRREVAIFYTTVFARNAVTWQSIVRGFGLLRFARKDDEWDSQRRKMRLAKTRSLEWKGVHASELNKRHKKSRWG